MDARRVGRVSYGDQSTLVMTSESESLVVFLKITITTASKEDCVSPIEANLNELST